AKDGVRLIVNNETVIETEGLGQKTITHSAALPEGYVPFRLEFFNATGEPVLKLRWAGEGMNARYLTPETGNVVSGNFLKLLDKYAGEIDPNSKESYTALRRALKTIETEAVPGRWATCVEEDGAEPPPSYIRVRGNAGVEGEAVTPAFPAVLDADTPVLPEPPPGAKSTYRRRVAANWIASEDNPLTARVMVNRIWQGHFGKGIVGTPNDFGLQGDTPTHPELLDWLSHYFMENGWQLKPLHRLILLSNTYRINSHPSSEALAHDPDNQWLSHFNMRRLTGEEVRDSMLAVSDALDPSLGGPGFYPTLPEAVLATSSMAQNIWHESPAPEQKRRSIYIHVKRSLLTPLLTDFDLADTDASCPVRFATVRPTQALNMLNSRYVNDQAAAFAASLRQRDDNGPEQLVSRAWQKVTGRMPTPEEVDASKVLMNSLMDEHGLDASQAVDRFCLVLFNLNEFLYLD
ncbi:MAG: DUF1553 domain-containing protein, partial [Candidatus Hydrogenedentes bacterium]|nr:DUF1553 domain-containing protein [Candidatus Hydrogenedentota bacterium]